MLCLRKEMGLRWENEAAAGRTRKSKAKIDYSCLCVLFRVKEERAVCENKSKGAENQWGRTCESLVYIGPKP